MATTSELVISRANGMHFVISDSNNPNPENTLSYNEKFANFTTREYCQEWDDGDTVTVQCASGTAPVPTVQVYAPHLVGTITATLKTSYTTTAPFRYYFEFDVAMSSYASYAYFQVKVTQGSVIWWSERQSAIDMLTELTDGYYVKLDWTNKNKTSDFINFQIDYTTNVEMFCYVEAQLKDFDIEAEDEIFNNIDEQKLISSRLHNKYQLKTDNIAGFMVNKIAIASKHFTFLINDLEYTCEGAPEIQQLGINLKSLTLDVMPKTILGFNSDDRGLGMANDIDYIKVRKKEDITDTWTFVVPAGYILHMLTCGHGTGSVAAYTFKAGYTVGGSDILTDYMTAVALSEIETFNLHEQESFDADKTVYIDITGTGAIAKIYANLLWNEGS